LVVTKDTLARVLFCELCPVLVLRNAAAESGNTHSKSTATTA
jgi:hypothetical protein